MSIITRSVWLLSLVSLFTDAASEMLYPIMPMYLKSIGFSVLLIGILEGMAEAVAGLSKGWFGKWSDSSGRRLPFVQIGYGLSAISKPLMAVFTYPLWIFGVRTLDRLGKGVRTGARDALLSAEASPETKGRIFGFHRSMDTLGAVIGPSIALFYLWFYPHDYQNLFLIALIPGLLAIVATLLLKEKATENKSNKAVPGFFSFLKYWKQSPQAYRRLSIGLLFFALFNSSDLFLLLQAKASGLDDKSVIGIYIFYNLVYAMVSYPMGALADRWGMKNTFLSGLVIFAFVYLGMATGPNLYFSAFLFLLYGIYAAATEGIAKAWISNISDKKDTATAIGTYSAFQSLSALLSSSMAGLIWYGIAPQWTFICSGIAALLAALYLWFFCPKPR